MKRLALISFSMFIKAVLNFAALIVFARILTPGEYGVYALVMTLVLMADAFAFMWLRNCYVRFFAEADAHRRHTTVSHILLMYVGLAGVCFQLAVVAMFVWPMEGMAPWVWLVVGGMMVGEGVFNLQLAHANNSRREGSFLALSVIKSFSSLAIGWWLVGEGYGVAGVLLGQLAAYTLAAVPALLAKRRIRNVFTWPPHKQVAAMLLAFGLPLALVGLLETLITTSHRTMVFHMLGAEALGIYAVSYDVVQKILVFLMLTLNTAMFPTVVRLLETQGVEAARAQLRQNAVVLVGLALPSAMGMALLAPQISAVFLGSQYVETAPPLLPWFILAALAKCAVSFYLAHAFYLSKTNRKLVGPMLLVTGLSICACYLGIRLWGIQGALAAVVLTWSAYAVMVGIKGRKQFSMPFPLAEISRVALATLVMALAVVPFMGVPGLPGLAVAGVAGGCVYVAAMVALDVLGSRAKLINLVRRKGRLA